MHSFVGILLATLLDSVDSALFAKNRGVRHHSKILSLTSRASRNLGYVRAYAAFPGFRGASVSLLVIPRQHAPEDGYQSDRNQEAAILPPHYFKPAKIVLASAAWGSHRIAPGEFRDSRGQVSRLERNLRRRSANSYRERSVLAGFQRRWICFEFEPDKRHGKRRRLALSAGNFQRSAAGLQLRWRKHDQRSWRRREQDRRLPCDRHLISVGIAAEALPKNLKAVRQRGDLRR